jgi:hypothetical protein
MVLSITFLFSSCSTTKPKGAPNSQPAVTTNIKPIDSLSNKTLTINYSLLAKGKCRIYIPNSKAKYVLQISFSNLPDSVSIIYPIDMTKELNSDGFIYTPIKYKDLADTRNRIKIQLFDFSDLEQDRTELMRREISKFVFIKVGKKVFKHPIAKFVYNQLVDQVFEELFPWEADIRDCDQCDNPRPAIEIDRSNIAYNSILAQKLGSGKLKIGPFPKLQVKLYWE